jgi:inosine/xanthosine triphosphatase
MKINIGSKNKTKIQSVLDAVQLYPNLFPDPHVEGIDVNVDIHGHPKNLKETIEGAIERAKQAFADCDYSFGLEGGLMEVPYSRSGFMEVGACAVYDGEKIHLGLSPAFEWPTEINVMILSGAADTSKAFKELGYTHHEKLGNEAGGIVGFLTDQKMGREDFTKYSIIMALIQLEKPDLYR